MRFWAFSIALLGLAAPTIATAQQPDYYETELPIFDEGNGQMHVAYSIGIDGDGYGLLSLRWDTPAAPQYLWSSSIYTFQWYQNDPPVWGYQDYPVTTTMTERDHGVDLEYSIYLPTPDTSGGNPSYICCGYGYVFIDAVWIGEAPTKVMAYVSVNGGSGNGPWAPIPASPAPEPEGWALMIGGFGLVGSAWRRRRMTGAPPLSVSRAV